MTKKSLLVLDDDAAVTSTIRAMAERLNFEVHATLSARSFFDVLDILAPSHIMIDLIMPQVDGVEVMLELARRKCDAHVIIISGAGSRVLDAAQRASIESGLTIQGTLSKPFSLAKFKALLEQDAFSGEQDIKPSDIDTQIPLWEGFSADLGAAIHEKQIKVVYQPKVRCSDQRVLGFEALARWHHPTQGAISPSIFVPLAEKNELIDDLTAVVFEQALDWMRSLGSDSNLQVAINLSARSLGDIRLADRLSAAAAARDIEPQRIILEVTETGAMADPLTTLNLATRLRLKGFHLSIDDFGTGYSSLAQLARLPFSELKIDLSFVRPLVGSRECQKIVKAIIGLGRSLGLRVTAEGVEDFEGFVLLRDMHCDLAQGFAIGRPMPGDAVAAWIANRDMAGRSSSVENGTALTGSFLK